MGLKVFDLPPNGIQDGAEAQLDKAQSTSEEVKPQIVTEQVSPEDPLIKKVKMPDGVTISPIIARNKLIFLSDDAKLVSYR